MYEVGQRIPERVGGTSSSCFLATLWYILTQKTLHKRSNMREKAMDPGMTMKLLTMQNFLIRSEFSDLISKI